jgi:hypothetical protein
MSKPMTNNDQKIAIENWSKQGAAEAIKWLKDNGTVVLSDVEWEAYRIGFRKGYQRAIGDLSLHGFIDRKLR